jgi:uncharacterized protein
MGKVLLGKSGMAVSKIGFGGIPIMRIGEDEAINVIRRAIDLGIDWIDTARGYSDSEEKIGKAIKGLPRESIRIFSKAPGKTPEKLKEQLETSLEKLDCGYLDMYQFHLVRSPADWEAMKKNGTLDLLKEMKSKGLIKHIGASAHHIEAALALLDDEFIEVLQWPFNFIMEAPGLEVMGKCREKNTGLIAMKPFGGGQLDNARVCIRYLMQYPGVAPDPGMMTIEQVEEVVGLANLPSQLSIKDKAEIKKLKTELGTHFCRMCEYCMPCEHGVKITTLMRIDSFIKRLSVEQVVSESMKEAVESVTSCVECGACETKCPYDLAIMQQIKQAAQRYQQFVEENS